MPVNVTRLEPHIYLTEFIDGFSYEDIADMRHQLHTLLQEHDDLDGDYVLVYHPQYTSLNLSVDIPSVRRMMDDSPDVATNEVVFIGLSPAFKLILNTLHRILGKGGHIHHVANREAALAKAHQLRARVMPD